jgi:DNA-binding CsgD family transcriptional regulator
LTDAIGEKWPQAQVVSIWIQNAQEKEIVAEGETALSPLVAKRLVQRAAGNSPVSEEGLEPLTERELEVLRLAAKGMGNKQIGSALSISDRTVQGHLATIYAKLHVSTRTEAVLLAVREKWMRLTWIASAQPFSKPFLESGSWYVNARVRPGSDESYPAASLRCPVRSHSA